MDWSQYLIISFLIFVPSYFFYNMHKQDKYFAELQNTPENK